MKTLIYVIKRISILALLLAYITWMGTKYNANIETILWVCILVTIVYMVGVIFCTLSCSKEIKKPENYKTYRQWKEPYRWQSGVDY